MNESAEVEQICEVELVTLFADAAKDWNESAIMFGVERVYRRMHTRAKEEQKVLVGVNQSISTESIVVGESQQIIYVITLVGTVVDSELIKQQQRLQQFNPRNVGRNN